MSSEPPKKPAFGAFSFGTSAGAPGAFSFGGFAAKPPAAASSSSAPAASSSSGAADEEEEGADVQNVEEEERNWKPDFAPVVTNLQKVCFEFIILLILLILPCMNCSKSRSML